MDNLFGQYLPIITGVISGLAFIVSLITQLIKDISFMKKIPTNLVVIVVSILTTISAYLIACSYYVGKIYWYGIIASIFAGFVVAYVSSYGWEKFHAIFERFRNKNLPK